jgi:tryptophanyl-tRNA synthetase
MHNLTFPPRVLSRIQPDSNIGLNQYGSLKNHIQFHHKYPGQAFHIITDYQYLAKDGWKNKDVLNKQTIEIATNYLALGLDPSKAFLYRQSDVPELLEISWIFNCIMQSETFNDTTSNNKIKQHSNLSMYPILMCSDILSIKANIIPAVGEELKSVEIVSNLANRFNDIFLTNLFPIPKANSYYCNMVTSTNDNHFNITYGNKVSIFNGYKELGDAIDNIVIDYKKASEKKASSVEAILNLFQLVAIPDKIAQMNYDYSKELISYKEAKIKLQDTIYECFKKFEDKYFKLKKRPDYVMDILKESSKPVRKESKNTLLELRQMMGIKKSC